MFGTSMLWAMGAFADASILAPDKAPGDVARAPAAVATADSDTYYSPSTPYVDASTLSVCLVDGPASSVSADAPTTPAAPAPDVRSTDTSDDVFAGWTAPDNFSNPVNDAFGASSTIGDMLHPGATTPVAPNVGAGLTGGNVRITPAFSAPIQSGGSAFNQTLGAALASLMNDVGNSAAPSAAPTLTSAASTQPSAAGAAGAAADAGGFAAPLSKANKVATPDKIHSDAANGAAPFSPAQVQQAYGFNLVSNKGAGQTIYIVDAFNDPNIAKDLATFDTQWGLPAANLTVHKMSSRIRNNSSWGVEESLDVEWAHAIAPQANIVLVEATTNSNSNLYAAVDWATNNGAHIVSMSWGGGDASGESSLDTHFNHAGVSYVASAGDTGGVVEYPSASPYVLSVGGTSLTLTTSNGYSSESAWSSGGGGASVGESEPGYQTSYGISLSGRGTPDVSYDADPNTGFYVYDSFIAGGGGWYEVGGTSAGAPQWAALIALADQSRSAPLSTNSLTSRSEYSAATGSVYATNYHDVTTGSNGHAAGTGYDLATGVGSPQANNLIPWLISH
jgi:subtilase family serine protease